MGLESENVLIFTIVLPGILRVQTLLAIEFCYIRGKSLPERRKERGFESRRRKWDWGIELETKDAPISTLVLPHILPIEMAREQSSWQETRRS